MSEPNCQEILHNWFGLVSRADGGTGEPAAQEHCFVRKTLRKSCITGFGLISEADGRSDEPAGPEL